MSAPAVVWAWGRKAGDPLAKLVLLTIAEQAGPDGAWEFSYEALAQRAEADPREIEAALRNLEHRGLVAVEHCVVRLLMTPPSPQAEARRRM